MSTPYPPPPFAPRLGTTSDIAEEEWQSFLRKREEFLRELQARRAMAATILDSLPETDPQGAATVADALFAAQHAREQADPSRYGAALGLTQEDINILRGRAQYYLGDQADLSQYSVDDLKRIIARGEQVRTERPLVGAEKYDKQVEQRAGAVLSGIWSAAARIPQHIPFIGDAIGKTRAMQRFQEEAAKFDEGFRGDLAADDKLLYNVLHGTGSGLTYLVPGALAWRAAGVVVGAERATSFMGSLGPIGKMAMRGRNLPVPIAAGPYGPSLFSFVGREAVKRSIPSLFAQGAVATWMLEGGGDDPWSQRALTIAAGGAIGAAAYNLDWYIQGLSRRLKDSFRLKWAGSGRQPEYNRIGPYRGSRDQTIQEAEWWFEPETGMPAPRRAGMIEPPDRALPPFVEPAPRAPTGEPPTARPPWELPESPRLLAPGPRQVSPEVAAEVQRIDDALINLRGAMEAPRGFEPEWGHEIPLRYTPDAQGRPAFVRVMTGEPNSLDIKEMDSQIGPIRQAVKFDEQGNIAAVFSQMQDLSGKVVVRPDLRRTGFGYEFMNELEANGFDLIGGVGRNAYTPEGRAAAEKWLNNKRARLLAESEPVPPVALAVDAQDDAIALTKQQTILESPVVGDLSKQASFDDSDVGVAALETNPGGIAILRNVGDVAKTVSQLTRKRAGRLSPSQIRVVERDVTPEEVWAPAIRMEGQVIEGERTDMHADVTAKTLPPEWEITELAPDPDYYDYIRQKGIEEGYVTTRGEYATREEAGIIRRNAPEKPPFLKVVPKEEPPQIFHSPMATEYGRKPVVAEPPKGLKTYIAIWSNAGGDWGISRMRYPKRGETVNLDANEVFLYAKNLKTAQEQALSLPTLPLYGGSFESRARAGVFGEEERRRAINPQGLRAVPGGGVPSIDTFIDLHSTDLPTEATRPTPDIRTDILVSEGLPITNKRVEQYKRFGFFEGQMARVGGVEVQIVKPGYPTTVRNVFNGDESLVLPKDIIPGRAAPAGLKEIPEAKSIYNDMKQYAMSQLASEVQAAGIARMPDWFSPEMTSQLPRYIEEYFNKTGVTNPITEAALLNYFNIARVNEFRSLAEPEDLEALDGIHKDAARAIGGAINSGRMISSLDNDAIDAGFAVDLNEMGGFLLRDIMTGEATPFSSEEEARAFIRNFNRQFSDVMEPGNAPEELISPIPGASHPGTAGQPIESDLAQYDNAQRFIERLQAEELEDYNQLSSGDADDFTRMVRLPNGRVGIAADESLARKLGVNNYGGDPFRNVIKELIQNSWDATLGIPGGGRINVMINFHDRTIYIIDNGIGMSPGVMENQLVDIGGSFKQKGSAGGYGLAKVLIFGNSEHITIGSVWRNPDTDKLVYTKIEGSGNDWGNSEIGMDFETMPGTGDYTGTVVDMKFVEDVDFVEDDVMRWIDTFIKYNTGETKVSFNVDGADYTGEVIYNQPNMPSTPTKVEEVDGAKIEYYVSRTGFNGNETKMVVLNSGLFQFEDRHYFYQTGNYPEMVIINVTPSVDTEHPGYPFTTSREEVKSATRININKTMEAFALKGGSQKVQDIMGAFKAGAPVYNYDNDVVPGFKVYPSSKDIPVELAMDVAGTGYAADMSLVASKVMDDIYKTYTRVYYSAAVPQFGGLGLSQSYLACNVLASKMREMYKAVQRTATRAGLESELMPEEDLPELNQILLNPFTTFRQNSGIYHSATSELVGVLSDYMGSHHIDNPDYTHWRDAIAYVDNADPELLPQASRELAANFQSSLAHEIVHQTEHRHDDNFTAIEAALNAMLFVDTDVMSAQINAMTSTWYNALRYGDFLDHWTKISKIYTEQEARNVFEEISINLDADQPRVPLGGDGQGEQDVAGGRGQARAGAGNDEGDVRRGQPPFAVTRPSGAYSRGIAAAGGSGGAGGAGGPPFLPGLGGSAGSLGPGSREVLSQLRRRGPMAAQALNDFVTDLGFRWFNMTYHAMRKLDVAIGNVVGMERVSLADQYTATSQGYTLMRNNMSPWMHEAEDILTNVRRRWVRDGTLVNVMEIGDTNLTIDTMTRLGFAPEERQAVWNLREFLDRFFRYMVADPSYKLGDADYIWGYVSRVRARQLAGYGDRAWDDEENLLPHYLKFFAEEMRIGQVDFREMHMGNILGRLIRGAMFHKYVRPSWEVMAQTWDQPGIPENVRAYIGGFLKFVQRGRAPQDDKILVGVRHMLNKVGIPATDQDMASLSGGMVGTMYRAYLGLRLDVLLRESMQWGMAASKIGYGPIRQYGFRPMLNGQWSEMLKRAVEKGWIEPGVPRGLYAGMFEEQAMVTGSTQPFYSVSEMPQMVERQHTMADRREAYARFMDHIVDRLPPIARKGIADTGLDPLYLYGKTTTWGKVLVGNAAYRHALETMFKYRQGMINLDQLHETLGSAYYGRPMRQFFDENLHQGNLDAAASRYANDVVADAMLKTGGHEQPEAMRQMGTLGRLGLMFGTFTIGTLGWLASGLGSGKKSAVKFATRYGMLLAAAAYGEAKTGFKFSRWLYHDALLFAGGPIVGTGLQTALAYRGVTNYLQGYTPSAGEMEAWRGFAPETAGSQLLRGLNPYAGGFRTIDRLLEGIEGPNATYYNTRFLVTGERPTSAFQSDIRQTVRDFGDAASDRIRIPVPGSPDAVPPFLLPPPPQDSVPGGGAMQ